MSFDIDKNGFVQSTKIVNYFINDNNMELQKNISLLLILAFGVFSCVQPPNYSNVPEIEFVQFNQDSITQGLAQNVNDTLEVTFSFTDGDGDIGDETEAIDVFLIDSRDNFPNPIKLPVIPNIGTENGISGEITVRIPNKPSNICCTYPDGSPPCTINNEFPVDTFSYQIYMVDRAGNESNRIQTDQITIICN
jgi:hypothetical protein